MNKIKKILSSINKFYEINIGFLFVNGQKQSEYDTYLKNKYKL